MYSFVTGTQIATDRVLNEFSHKFKLETLINIITKYVPIIVDYYTLNKIITQQLHITIIVQKKL